MGQEIRLPAIGSTTATATRLIECSFRSKIIRAQKWALTNSGEDVGLFGLERHKATQNMQYVKKLGGVVQPDDLSTDLCCFPKQFYFLGNRDTEPRLHKF